MTLPRMVIAAVALAALSFAIPLKSISRGNAVSMSIGAAN